MTTILVGTDSSAAADLAVDHAARLARDRESDLVVLLVRPDGDLRSVVDPGKAADPDRYLAHVAERFPGLPTSTRVEHGEAAERIVVAGPGQHPQPGAQALAVQRVHRGHEARTVKKLGMLGLAEEREHRHHATVHVGLLREAELVEHRVD